MLISRHPRGEILLFDYRPLHKGLGNTRDKSRELLHTVFKQTGPLTLDAYNSIDKAQVMNSLQEYTSVRYSDGLVD
eukprot:scaffold1958_cov198-Alexandrium_tamarense.AAC.13